MKSSCGDPPRRSRIFVALAADELRGTERAIRTVAKSAAHTRVGWWNAALGERRLDERTRPTLLEDSGALGSGDVVDATHLVGPLLRLHCGQGRMALVPTSWASETVLDKLLDVSRDRGEKSTEQRRPGRCLWESTDVATHWYSRCSRAARGCLRRRHECPPALSSLRRSSEEPVHGIDQRHEACHGRSVLRHTSPTMTWWRPPSASP